MAHSLGSPSWSHARQTPTDSYFPNSTGRSAGMLKRHHSSIHPGSVEPLSATQGNAPTTPQPMNLSLRDISSPVDDLSDFGGGAPPSPSTLTDIILSLHASLYGAKRSDAEIREMVLRYYDGDASASVFDSPLVSAHGRKRIEDQFILAFAFPGIEIRSELRDVICSDFEFDGTRAGIIDHTITVSLFPNLFRSRGAGSDGSRFTPGPLTSHGNITPHPFANYQTPTTADGGASRRQYSMGYGQMSPATPFSAGRRSSISGGGWSSRPRTPSHGGEPLTLRRAPSDFAMGGGDQGTAVDDTDHADLPKSASMNSLTGPTVDTRPAMPADAGAPHWSAQGLGRSSIWTLLYNLLTQSRALHSLFSIELRLLSRLEFNDAGRIVRHEDSWSLRELVDGVVPFLSLFYNIERFFMGLFISWVVRLIY
ncbi:hypothetical protein MSPP1_002862 [Malassezia sp. CBS 17886]|nr:hypothetical protein MSPP1_002862 [Malassezia sp. CBS 17886]